MAFTQETFASVGAHSANTPNVYSYKTDDLLAAVTAPGYFQNKVFQLEKDDTILAVTADGHNFLKVLSDTGSVSVIVPGTSQIGIRKIIQSEDDYPAEVGGKVPLLPGVDYFHVNSFSTNKQFTHTGTVVFSSPDSSAVTIEFTNSGTIFEAQDSSIVFSDISGSAPNGLLLDYEDTAGNEKTNFIYFDNATFSADRLGDLTNLGDLFVHASDLSSITRGFDFIGSDWGQLDIDWTDHSTSAGAIYELGTALFDGITIDNVSADLGGSSVFLSGASGGANIASGGIGTIIQYRQTGAGSALNGITTSDPRWDMQLNDENMGNSGGSADVFLQGGQETITTGSAGDWQQIGVPSAGGVSWGNTTADRFSVGADGVITYLDEKDINLAISGRATVEKTGGGSEVLEVRVAINWDGTPGDSGLERSGAQTENNKPTSVSVGALTPLSTGDNIRLIFSNTNGTSNIIVSKTSMELYLR